MAGGPSKNADGAGNVEACHVRDEAQASSAHRTIIDFFAHPVAAEGNVALSSAETSLEEVDRCERRFELDAEFLRVRCKPLHGEDAARLL
jgi:hypothetical protein